jgi:hypothetical protein
MTDIREQTDARQAFAELLAKYQATQRRIAIEASAEGDVDTSIDRLCYLEQRLWRTEAPDLRAVLVKFEIANADCDMPPPEATASILADLRRLSGETVSPTFQPDLWLAQWEAHGGSYLVRDGEALICGFPTNAQQRRLSRELDTANGTEAVKAMIFQRCKGLEVEASS